MLTVAGFDRYDVINTPKSAEATFTVWFAGCTHGCKGCHNKVLWDKNIGNNFDCDELFSLIVKWTQKANIKTVTLLGGEPLQQNLDELIMLCKLLSNAGHSIWIYTGYDFDEVPVDILEYIDYIKCGRYIEELRAEDESAFPITTNQRLYSKADGWQSITI